MKSDEIYNELRQIKLDAVNAEVGWYNGRADHAIQAIDDMLARLHLIRDEVARKAEGR